MPGLSTIQRHLTGGLKYDDEGNLYRDVSREAQSYVGNSSDVNDAWKVFDAGEWSSYSSVNRDIDMQIVQTIELDVGTMGTEGLYRDRRPMVITIPDVYHQLHCLVSLVLNYLL